MSTEKTTKHRKPSKKPTPAFLINDVSFVSFSCELLNGFDPAFDDRADNLSYQTRVNLDGYEIIREDYFNSEEDLNDGDANGTSVYTLKVTIELGVRFGAKGTLSRKPDDPEVLALVTGTIAAYYKAADESVITDENSINYFISEHSTSHVWPYWREFVSSSLSRTNLKKITLPYMKAPANKNSRPKQVTKEELT